MKGTAVCIVDDTGKICREVKVASHPEDLISVIKDPKWQIERIGLEAGPLSQWLYEGIATAGLPVICIETRHAKAVGSVLGLTPKLNEPGESKRVGGVSCCGDAMMLYKQHKSCL
ncbi:transposase [Rhizobium sp. BK176]|nr:transposase [Rhizobium sp. BK176]